MLENHNGFADFKYLQFRHAHRRPSSPVVAKLRDM